MRISRGALVLVNCGLTLLRPFLLASHQDRSVASERDLWPGVERAAYAVFGDGATVEPAAMDYLRLALEVCFHGTRRAKKKRAHRESLAAEEGANKEKKNKERKASERDTGTKRSRGRRRE